MRGEDYEIHFISKLLIKSYNNSFPNFFINIDFASLFVLYSSSSLLVLGLYLLYFFTPSLNK